MEKLKCGVPQGSLFFISYINDLPNALELSKSYLFADDTSIYYSNSDIKQLEFVLNSELRKLNNQTWDLSRMQQRSVGLHVFI